MNKNSNNLMLCALGNKKEGTMKKSLSIGLLVFLMSFVLAVSAFGEDRLIVQDAGGNTQFVVTEDGDVGIGTSTPSAGLDIIGADSLDAMKVIGNDRTGIYSDLHVSKQDYWSLNFFDVYSSLWSGHAPYFNMRRARGTMANLAAVQNGDQIGGFSYRGYDGAIWQQRALISALVDGPVSAGVVPVQLRFFTGSTANTQRMVITSSGNVGIGTTNPVGTLDVNGPIYQRGVLRHADYVYSADYKLESIEEHAKYMWENKHLKAVSGVMKDENGQEIVEVGAHQRGILEELEKAHIYIEQLSTKIKELEIKLNSLNNNK
jgi:hypothetical protein